MNRTAVVVLCAALAACLSPARAQAPAAPRVASIEPAPAVPGAVSTPYLMAVEAKARGERVMSVDNRTARREPVAVAPVTTDKLLYHLQAVGEAYSPEAAALIPFAVRGTWVLAPETRDQVTTDFRNVTPADATSRGDGFAKALAALSPEQRTKLGAPEGLPVSEMPAAAQAAMARALRPPFRIQERSVTYTGAGVTFTASGAKGVPPITIETLDLKRIRVRMRLRSNGAVFSRKPVAGSQAMGAWFPLENPGTLRRREFLPASSEGFFWASDPQVPALARVPNSYKPSDLDGARFSQPIGISGTFSVARVLERLSAATGLRLVASVQYREWPVYLGSPQITCGEVLDGLRLALTAAWRKLGDRYLLTWDRAGLRALQTMVEEGTQSLRDALSAERGKTSAAIPMMDLGLTLPFAEDDPFAWSEAQRQGFFGPSADPEVYHPRRGDNEALQGLVRTVAFPQMTPEQQGAVRAIQETMMRQKADLERHGRPSGGVVLDDLNAVQLLPEARIETSVFVPEAGWVAANVMPGARLNAYEYSSRYRREWIAQHMDQLRTEWKAQAPPAPKPGTLVPARERSLLTPALAPEELAPVLKAMRSKGFRTLYYPALIGGYATFPTKAFPPHPDLKGANGLAAAVKAAKAEGLQTVAVVETLAWRKPGARDHWLDAHPDWLDVDVLGRPIRSAVDAWISLNPKRASSVAVRGDLVRPSVARARLFTLLDDLARQPGLHGVFLDAWSVATDQVENVNGFPVVVLLGFQAADRLAMLEETGADPADVPVSSPLFKPADTGAVAQPLPRVRPEDGKGSVAVVDGSPNANGQGLALVNDLIAHARANGQRWALSASYNGYLPNVPYLRAEAPASDAILQYDGPDHGGSGHELIVMPSKSVLDKDQYLLPADRERYDMAMAEQYGGWWTTAPYPEAIYDFRDAPERILPSLKAAVLSASGVDAPKAGAQAGS